jgi:L-seryl-tRNA(Ser) seleniumtransferase
MEVASPMAVPRPVRPPAVEAVLVAVRAALEAPREHAALAAAARLIVAEERVRLRDGQPAARDVEALAAEVIRRLDATEQAWSAGLTPVINATGVVIHTNLGRAPWPRAAIDAARAAAADPLLLELDRETGRRGHRYRAAEELLVELTGAEDALVTNNNAAAVALAVGLAGRGRGVAVSRGELVEIGGGVRIPEIVRRAGARLVEVGTTNRTRAADFEAPLADGRARVVLRVHRSNFRQDGFTEDPDPAALAGLAHGYGAIVVDDLGSGALLDTASVGLAHEPMPAERLAAGSDLVTFSGDKLVGGPQAGLIVGRADLVARIRRDPLARAMRPDKSTLAAVAATLGLYASGRAMTEVPVWRMLAADREDLERRATVVARSVGPAVEVASIESTVGGGSLPGATIPSAGLALRGGSADRLAARLRMAQPAVVGRIEDGALILDLRTVEPDRDVELAAALRKVLRAAR